MFVIVDTTNEPIRWPVKVEQPIDGGKVRTFEFTGIFRRLSADEKEALGKEVGDDMMNDDQVDWVQNFIDRTMQVMTGWEGVVDQDKNKLEFTAEALRRAIRAPSGASFMKAINRAITEFETGTKAKN